ncbi:MAG: creatininase family protein [candidate division Zixibacteria bacterium]|nr:creatininase family protein [candidate division Zixibacteria bacterium]
MSRLPYDRPVQLWKMTRRQFREGIYDGSLKAAIIPTGSTEQHNEHLEMSHDTDSAVYVAERVAAQLYPGVVVTTPISIGISEHWMDHKGTLTTRPEIFTELLYDVADSMKRGGITHVLAVNGHAGNAAPVRNRLDELRARLGIDFDFCCYWDAYTREVIEKYMESGNCPGHASEFETSFAFAAFPGHVHWEGVDYDAAKLTISLPDRATQDRNFHHEAKLAHTVKGQAMIDIAVSWVAEKLNTMMET